MRALDKKLVRDLIGMKGQVVAITLVIASGVATFVMSLSTLKSLSLTQESYYERYRFAQVFSHLKRAPKVLAARIGEIPGVARVQTRTVVDVTLDVPGLLEPAVGRLISIPERPSPGLNALYLRGGRYIEPGRPGEVLASEAFAIAHGLRPGGRAVAVINGKREILKVVGIALSPEYVYQIRDGDILPDDKRFGVFWMGEPNLAAAFDMTGAFNDVALAVMPGAAEAEVVRRLDRLTASYGGLGAYGRADQISSKFVTNEVRELRGVGVAIPIIFLAVGAFLLNIVLTRMIDTQREQIAALRAFGYTNVEVGVHYFKFVGLIVGVSVALGSAVGGWMGHGLTRFYTRFFHFPVFLYRLDVDVVLLALLVCAAAALMGTMGAIHRAVRLPPAEAMRPEPPSSFRRMILERCMPRRLLSPAARMILRQLRRRPVRSLFSTVGIALSVAVMVLGNFTADAIDSVIDFQFFGVQRNDVSVMFVEPSSVRTLAELRHVAGVVRVEPFRSVPVRLRSGHRSRRQAVLGLEPGGSLYRPLNESRRPVSLTREGLVLSAKLAELLDVRPGDDLSVEVLEGARPVRQVRVVSLVSDYEGTSAYMELGALNRLMREGPTVSGAFLEVDPVETGRCFSRLKNTPRVASVTVKKAVLDSFRRTIAESLLRMQSFNITFAAIIACGVVYNCSRISFIERSRELATLRVIGFTRAEVSMILLGELSVMTLIGLPVGLMIGTAFAAVTTRFYDTELFRIPLVIYPSTYAMAAAATIVSASLSGLMVRRRIDELDLVSVLKTKE